MIDVKNLTKRYGDLTAIHDVSFRVEKGEILGLLGPNGAGKTTTMRILTGCLSATSGTAAVAGRDIFDHPMDVKRQIGYLPENPPLYGDLTVTEFLTFAGRIRGMTRKALPSALEEVLGRCSLGDVRKRLIKNLSRGYQQRVGLAQALIHSPAVLVLDEPTIGLDPKQIIEMRHLIKGLAGMHTVILSSHILPEVTATCQRVVIIHQGRVVAEDSPARLSTSLRRKEAVSLVVARPSPAILSVLKALPGVISVAPDKTEDGAGFLVETGVEHDIREEIAHCAVTNNWGLLEIKRLPLTLEDVFLQLTTEEKEDNA